MKLEDFPFIDGCDRSSFAYFTVETRFPKILRDIIRTNDLPSEINESLNSLIDEMPYHTIAKIPRNISNPFWERFYTRNLGKSISDIPFFDAEIYFYELILSVVKYREHQIDPFFNIKCKEVLDKLDGMDEIIAQFEKINIKDAIRNSVLGNQADLSQLSRSEGIQMIIDDSPKLERALGETRQVHYFLDNSATELFSDLVLMLKILETYPNIKINAYLKKTPLLVSDATRTDLEFLLDMVNEELQTAVDNYYHDGRLTFIEDEFWSLPAHFTDLIDYPRIRMESPDLVISKGDLNYRRFFEDRDVPKDFRGGAKLCQNQFAFCTLKSEIMAGFDLDKATELTGSDPQWMVNGRYAVVQKL